MMALLTYGLRPCFICIALPQCSQCPIFGQSGICLFYDILQPSPFGFVNFSTYFFIIVIIKYKDLKDSTSSLN